MGRYRNMYRKWTPLNFGKYRGKSLFTILTEHQEWFFWAYREEFFDQNKTLKEEALLILLHLIPTSRTKGKEPKKWNATYNGKNGTINSWADQKGIYQQDIISSAEESQILQHLKCIGDAKDIKQKTKELFCYSVIAEPELKNRIEQQVQAALNQPSNCPKKRLTREERTLLRQYLLLYLIQEKPFFYAIDGHHYKRQAMIEKLGIEKDELLNNTKEIEAAFKKVRFDLYNFRTAAIEGEELSKSKGIRLLKKIIEDKDRKGVQCDSRTLRSLKETLKGHGVPQFILERLKWKNGRAKTTFEPGRLKFTGKIVK